jgi:hypothetical protein
VNGLLEGSDNGHSWFIANTFGYAVVSPVTAPFGVSCVPQQFDNPRCVAVGEHFKNPRFPAQLVEAGGINGFSPVASRNPKGATWSVLNDVSCASLTFCMLVGSDGTTRRTAHGLRYISHANAYTWNGSSAHRLSVPVPARARTAELAGVSCAAVKSCMTVGNYTTQTGRSLPFSAQWNGATWAVRSARTISGKASTFFQAVSCTAAARCVGVGDAVRPGSAAFAEQYASGTWTVLPVTARSRSAFFSVSCPAAAYCVAAGNHGTRSLIEAWNGAKWTAQSVPATPAPLTTDVLFHVSCVSSAICAAVGYRHNPGSRFAYHTLAAYWNGASWTITKSANQAG